MNMILKLVIPITELSPEHPLKTFLKTGYVLSAVQVKKNLNRLNKGVSEF